MVSGSIMLVNVKKLQIFLAGIAFPMGFFVQCFSYGLNYRNAMCLLYIYSVFFHDAKFRFLQNFYHLQYF